MSGETVLDAANDLGWRFVLVSLFPTGVLALFILALIWSGAPHHAPALSGVVSHAEAVKGWSGLVLVAAILAFTLMVEPLQLTLVRLFEGYWGESSVGRLLAAPALALQAWRVCRLVDAQSARDGETKRTLRAREAAARKLDAYPPEAGLLPTRLGNILRASEHRAGYRYGLEAVTAWPRLYPLLDDKVVEIVDDLRAQLDRGLRFCVVFVAAGVVSAVVLASYGWWLAVPVASFGLAWVGHRASLAAAAAYGLAVEAAFDLHHFDLLHALHFPLPATLSAEIATNEAISEFLGHPAEYLAQLRNGAGVTDFAYDHQQADPAGA